MTVATVAFTDVVRVVARHVAYRACDTAQQVVSNLVFVNGQVPIPS